ncbi:MULTISPECIES: nitrogen regulation protein NR(II) [unclassified Shewanella]|jgi:two-component system nitrogen regulation sensor histidine kinase GlnL|uniref:nitrogen regulation protein NR(II) n=1 Tax=unclassified Shewanella TaxID=196818 RepID=UPI000C330B3F|nr:MULTISPECIES: nitrogen regulation protein NR(II) [unclassified Shewanella]MBB1360846.1 nitrogen regulation protein NR(II) [Shewanella sp. SR44-4]PKH34410.1 nitrogen regulation protein NR(II) [Shewanella sp. ALD9]QHS11918.1 nitrogen regulation protein NR(II) [Shewanella sp. Arc9-LZ]
MDTNNLLNHLVTAVLVINNELKPSYANAAAAQLLGVGNHKLLEQTLPELYQLMGVEPQLLRDAINAGQGLTVNTAALITLDGQHHTIDITLMPIENDNNLSILELRQVDQQRRIHQQLNMDAQQQAAQFLVRNLAHEIKNPLGGLRGAAQLLSRELDSPELKEFTSLIIEQADRLRNLVDRLLGPQRPTQHAEHNIHQVIQKVLKLVEMALPDNICLKRDYDPSIPDIQMDPDQMQQAVLNIVQNAIQALEHCGGDIVIRTRTQHQVTIGTQRYKVVLALSIIDNGPGIPAELMDTLFYPMVTGRDEGSGLGLSIAHNIARLHGGRIDCVSAPGHTEFIINLPLQ